MNRLLYSLFFRDGNVFADATQQRIKYCQTKLEGGSMTKLVLQLVAMDPEIVLPSLRFLRFQVCGGEHSFIRIFCVNNQVWFHNLDVENSHPRPRVAWP